MEYKDGNNLIQQISSITLLHTDKELVKHFSPDAPEVFRKCADRIEEVFKRQEKCQDIPENQSKS